MLRGSDNVELESGLEKANACRADGNICLEKGDFADACNKYDEGLLALATLRAPDERVPELRLALHLNASLANLRRGNLASAVDHADGALAIDEKSVKALYRRGLAKKSLSEHAGHEHNAQSALDDFEKALTLDPNNAETRKQVQALRVSLRAEKLEVAKSQREAYKNTFKNVFASDKPLYKDVTPQKVDPIIRADPGAADAQPVLSACAVHFHYERGVPILEGVDLALRAGHCVGLFGNNSSGKTTLARLFTEQLSPVKGEVIHHSKEAPGLAACLAPSALAAGAVAVLAAGVGEAVRGHKLWKRARLHPVVRQLPWWLPWLAISSLAVLVAGIVCYLLYRWRSQAAKHRVVLVSSDHQDKERISDKMTIEKVIGERLPKKMHAEARQEKVIAMLTAAGFQMYNQETQEPIGNPTEYVRDGLQFGHLSGGQKHLIYILRCFAMKPDVLLCDELLGGLDQHRQPRVLHMLKRLQQEAGVAVMYITCELHQLRLVADSIGFVADHTIAELGPAMEVLEAPKHPGTKDYVGTYRSLPGCQVLGGKLGENFNACKGDPDLVGPWLPP